MKKDGAINHIVYNQTMYNEGKNRFYLPINHLIFLIDEIVKTNQMTKYIHFNPFYITQRTQLEFEEFIFHILLEDDLSKIDYKRHLEDNFLIPYNELTEEEKKSSNFDSDLGFRKNYTEMTEWEKEYLSVLRPICETGNIKMYHEQLLQYRYFLNKLIPFLFEKVKKKISEENIPFGYFCFEVHSG